MGVAMKIRIRPTDKLYSRIIRKERPICEVCHKKRSKEVHHFYSRNHENTRFDDENIISCCFSCHRLFHSNPNFDRKQWMLRKIGQKNTMHCCYDQICINIETIK